MKEKEFSSILKELRYALALSQTDMAKTLGMSLKMYSLYETGKYDAVAATDIRRKQLMDKIELVKNKIVIGRGKGQAPYSDFAFQELEKKYQQAQAQILELQQKIISLQEHIMSKSQKTLAHATSPKKN